MKKLSALLLVAVLLFSLSACDNTAGVTDKNGTLTLQGEADKNITPTNQDATTQDTTVQDAVTQDTTQDTATQDTTAQDTATQDTADTPANDQPAQDTSAKSEKNEQQNGQTAEITREKALEIALKKAGVKRADIRDLDIELDTERGIKVWEVDFECGNLEYSYEINAATGAVTKVERERD